MINFCNLLYLIEYFYNFHLKSFNVSYSNLFLQRQCGIAWYQNHKKPHTKFVLRIWTKRNCMHWNRISCRLKVDTIKLLIRFAETVPNNISHIVHFLQHVLIKCDINILYYYLPLFCAVWTGLFHKILKNSRWILLEYLLHGSLWAIHTIFHARLMPISMSLIVFHSFYFYFFE